MPRKGVFTKTLTLPNGKRKYFYGKSMKEAEEKLQKAKFELGMGIDIDNDITFGELAEIWYNVYKKPRLKSPNSQAAVLNVLNNHLLPTLSHLQVRKITAAQIQATLNRIAESSSSLQSKALQTLRSIFRMAVEDGIIVKTPITMTVHTSPKPVEEKEPLNQEQTDRLLAAVTGTNAETFVRLGLFSGLRRGEILGLQWSDIDLDNQIIHVRHNALLQDGKPTTVSDRLKTASSKRTIPIPSALTNYLQSIRKKSTSPFVISMKNGSPMSKTAYRAMWRIITMRTIKEEVDPITGETHMQELGSSPRNHPGVVRTLDFHVHPHLLRHTYITRLFANGVDLKTVQYLAGHSTPDVTLRVYIHYLKSQKQEEAAEKIERAFSPQKVQSSDTTPVQH